MCMKFGLFNLGIIILKAVGLTKNVLYTERRNDDIRRVERIGYFLVIVAKYVRNVLVFNA